MGLETITRDLCRAVSGLRFGQPVTHVYNPLEYAWAAHRRYLEFGRGKREVVLLGMNPGPWGMAQTGIPFGDVSLATEWMGIRARVRRPAVEHPRRPVLGFACQRREVSGSRLWGWARDTFGTPGQFFRRFFVINYCPLCFMESSGRNRTPDKLPAGERGPLFDICDSSLRRMIDLLQPEHVIGVGRFAEGRARAALEKSGVLIGHVPHPSPANPAANRGWTKKMSLALRQAGVRTP